MNTRGTFLSVAFAGVALCWALSSSGCAEILGIGDPKPDTGEGGASSAGPGTTGPGTTTGSTSGGPGTGSGGAAPCALTDPQCLQIDSDCVALIDNRNSTDFALRMAQVQFFKPDVFTGTFEMGLILNSLVMNLPACNLTGSGTFSWIVELDKGTGKYTVGVSKPVQNPNNGYAFVNETISLSGQNFTIQPVTGNFTLGADGTLNADVLNFIYLPVYLDAQGNSVLLIPVHQLHMYETKLSADNNCVGKYNEWGLLPTNDCDPDYAQNSFPFVSGGKVEGYILLEEADDVIITAYSLNRSLCVLLSPSAGIYGDGGNPNRCERDGNGNIKLPGDWCSTTNAPADPSCHDAMKVKADIAASAVKLNP